MTRRYRMPASYARPSAYELEYKISFRTEELTSVIYEGTDPVKEAGALIDS